MTRHLSASIGGDDEDHSIRINTTPSPINTSSQYVAKCRCGWITVNVTARMTEAQAVRHYTGNQQ